MLISHFSISAQLLIILLFLKNYIQIHRNLNYSIIFFLHFLTRKNAQFLISHYNPSLVGSSADFGTKLPVFRATIYTERKMKMGECLDWVSQKGSILPP